MNEADSKKNVRKLHLALTYEFQKGFRAGVVVLRDAVLNRGYIDDYGDEYIRPESVREEAERLKEKVK